MNSDTAPQLTLVRLKQRLNRILDNYFSALQRQQLSCSSKIVSFNESLLQEWSDILSLMVAMKDRKKVSLKGVNKEMNSQEEQKIPWIKQIKPKLFIKEHYQTLISVQNNSIRVFKVVEKTNKQFEGSTLHFKKGIVHRFCSIIRQDDSSFILSGGCRESDPNLKSHDILRFNAKIGEVVKIGQMSYGLASHGSVKIGSMLFIVGGRKNEGIITKKCLKFDLVNLKDEKIRDLNYPVASHSLFLWKQKYIYKFGGIGSCFGEMDVSPYIQRYSVRRDEWQLVNPSIRIDQTLMNSFSLMINSLCFESQKGSIIVLGGFNLNHKQQINMFEIEVIEQEPEKHKHTMITLGKVKGFTPGGFPCQETLNIGNSIYSLQSIVKEKHYETAIIQIGETIRYL